MPAYDGSISINTQIDNANINTATKSINTSFEKMGNSIKGILSNITAMVAGYISVAAALQLISQYNLRASSFGGQIFQLNWAFQTLEGSIVNLLMTAFVPMIPVIIQVISWVTKLVQFLTLIVGALFGMKQTIGDIVKSGALAAFDKINTLNANPYGPAASPPPMTIPKDLLDKVAALKKAVSDLLAPLLYLWNLFMVPFGKWIQTVALPWLLTQLNDFIKWAKDNPGTVIAIIAVLLLFALAWGIVSAAIWLASAAAGVFTVIMGILTSPITAVIVIIAALILIVILLIVYWKQLGVTLNELGYLIKYYFGLAWDWLKQKVIDVWTSIRNFIKGVINDIIGFINGMVQGFASGINSVISGLNSVGSVVPGFHAIGNVTIPQIPRLASGAVIPPNSAFLAIMGDQRSGRNIEAPEALFQEMLNKAAAIGSNQNITITFTGGGAEIARMLKPHIDRENVRVGNNLIKRSGQVNIK